MVGFKNNENKEEISWGKKTHKNYNLMFNCLVEYKYTRNKKIKVM